MLHTYWYNMYVSKALKIGLMPLYSEQLELTREIHGDHIDNSLAMGSLHFSLQSKRIV